jgi:hypothetical protein
MGECDIPGNIDKRKSELERYSARLERNLKELANIKRVKSNEEVEKMV